MADRVWRITVRATIGSEVVGSAVGEVGALQDLIAWKRDSGLGGWAGDEWRMFSDKDRVGYFSLVFVDSQKRGRGIGRSLSLRLVREMDKLRADVIWLVVVPMDGDTDGNSLVDLYASIGFSPVYVAGREEDRPMMIRRANDVVISEHKHDGYIDIEANLRGDIGRKAFAVGVVGDEMSVAGRLWDLDAKVAPAELEASPGTYGYIERVYVPSRVRQRGIGRRLVTAIVKRMTELGARDVFLESASEADNFSDEDLVKFYESIGFRRHAREPYGNLLHLRQEPGDGDGDGRRTNPARRTKRHRPTHTAAMRQAAGVFVMARDSGRILLVRRASHVSTPGVWGMPAGKLEADESPEVAAARELKEETGLALDHRSLRFAFVCRTPEGGHFYAYVGAVESETPVTLTAELDQHQWVGVEDALPGKMHPQLVEASARRSVRDGMASAIRSAIGSRW